MKTRSRRGWPAVAAALILTLVGPASGAGTSGALLMKQELGARPLALGSSYVSLSADPYALIYNPAGLGLVRRAIIETDFQAGLADARTASLLYAQPIGRWGGLGVGAARQEAGTIDVFNNNGTVETRRGQDDFLVSLGYGYATRPSWRGPGRFAVGAAVKYFQSTIAEQSHASAAALDAGLLWETPWYATLGASISNLGSGVGYAGGGATGEKDPLPRTVRVGASVPLLSTADRDAWLVTTDASQTREETLKVRLGTEFIIAKIMAVRFGYVLGDDLGSFSTGFGLNWGGFDFAYGLSLMSSVNHRQSASLGYRFGSSVERLSYADLHRRHNHEMSLMPAALFKQGQYFRAREAIEREPLLPEAEETKKKIGDIVQSAIDAGPTVNPQMFYYANAYRTRFAEKMWAKIAVDLEQALAYTPVSAELTEQLSAARKNAAAQSLQMAADSQKLYMSALKQYQKKRYDAAIAVLRESLQLNPANPDALKLLDLAIQNSIAQERSKYPAPRVVEVKAAPPVVIKGEALVAYDPVKAEELYKEGLVAYIQQHYEQSIQLLTQALGHNPGNDRIKNTLERVKREVKR